MDPQRQLVSRILAQEGKPSQIARALLGFDADGKQAEVLDCAGKRILLCCSRQWGKSTTAAALVALRGMREPGSLVVCVSPTLRQTEEFVSKVRGFLERLGLVVSRSKQRLVLCNGSRILGLPGQEANVRGFSAPRMVVIDEAARVGDALYQALRPMLAGGGDLVLLSTPFGERGFFWREWTRGGAEWTRIEAKASECERFGAEFLEEERRAQGAAWFGQEYECSFLGLENQVFRQEWLERARRDGEDVAAHEFLFEGEM